MAVSGDLVLAHVAQALDAELRLVVHQACGSEAVRGVVRTLEDESRNRLACFRASKKIPGTDHLRFWRFSCVFYIVWNIIIIFNYTLRSLSYVVHLRITKAGQETVCRRKTCPLLNRSARTALSLLVCSDAWISGLTAVNLVNWGFVPEEPGQGLPE